MTTSAPVLPNVHKIAVLRANGLGDLIFTLPALAALRAAYPAAEIVLLGKGWHRDFFAGRPGSIDRVVVIPPYGGVGALEAVGDDSPALSAFFAAMRAEHFDLALQFHGGGRHSNPFVRRLGARVTAGLRTPDAAPLDRTIPYIYYQGEIMRYLEVAALVGAAPVTLEPRIMLTEADQTEAAHVYPASAPPLVVLHPGATDPRRWWPANRFAAVAAALAAGGQPVAVIGAAEERALADAVLAAGDAPILDLCDKLTLGGLAALLARSRLIIANDSGPLHLAAAVGTPTVGIFWCGNLITAGPPTRARQRPQIAWRLTCPVCGAHFIHDAPCAHHASVVDDVATADVLAAARELLLYQTDKPVEPSTRKG